VFWHKVAEVSCNEREEIVVAVVVSELHLFEVEREGSWSDAVMFHEAFFGVAPEAFQPIDMYASPGEMHSVIDFHVAVATEHKTVVDLELVGVDDAAAPDFGDGETEDGFRFDIGHDLHRDLSVSFKNTEHRDFPGSTTSPFAFPSASKVRLIEFDLAVQEIRSVRGMSKDRRTDRRDGFIRSSIGKSHLLGDLPAGQFQLKELDDPQPLAAGKVALIDPATTEIVEGVSASRTSSPVTKPIQLPHLAARAESVSIFQAEFRHESSR